MIALIIKGFLDKLIKGYGSPQDIIQSKRAAAFVD